ncbi:MAG: sialidase family protein [Geodermatophilaceae bacterium]
MSTRSTSTRLAVVISACLLASLVGTAPGNAGPAWTAGSPDVSRDALSGAALNALAAIAQRDRPLSIAAPQVAGPDQPASLVNDPTDDATAQDTQSETTITVAGPNLVAAFNDSGSFIGGESHFTGYSTSSDGGQTWTDRGQLPDSSEGDAGDPVLATDTTSGRVYMATLGFNTFTNIQMFRSDDNGATFGQPVNATPGFGSTNAFQDKEWVTVDNYPGAGQGNVYLGWRQFGGPGEGLKFTRSTDGGATWGPNQGTPILPGDGQGAFVVVSPDHCVHFFYLSDIFGGNIIKVRKSCDQGVTFGPAVTITDIQAGGINGDLGLKGGLRSNTFPQAAVNPVTGTLYVTYSDLTATNGADVFLKSSTDGGATWSAPVRINRDGTDNDQFFPTVGITTTGRALMVGWYDRRRDAANFDLARWSRVAAINARTGALTFSSNFQLGPSFPVVIGQDPVINTVYMGDYDQIAADANNFYSTWADNSLSNAFHANQPDVRFGRVFRDGTILIGGL